MKRRERLDERREGREKNRIERQGIIKRLAYQ
jgi:hypothetical protein